MHDLVKAIPTFRLVKSETQLLTPQLAEKFQALTPSPTEREYDEGRANMLRTKAKDQKLVAFNWAVAKFGNTEFRMNGQHSSKILCELNGEFPHDLRVHLDTYEVTDREGLADLFRQFDNRKSGRTPRDVAGAYQGLHTELSDVSRATAKLGIEGVNWYETHIEGLARFNGDDVYKLFSRSDLYEFLHWLDGEIISVKTPELKRQTVAAAIYGTFHVNEHEARTFWQAVSRGGVEFEDNHPATQLDAFLKSLVEDKRKADLKPAHLYQAAAYAWNAFREDKPITTVKYDTKKGLNLINE